jgi:inhibitor of cysteine peptidase
MTRAMPDINRPFGGTALPLITAIVLAGHFCGCATCASAAREKECMSEVLTKADNGKTVESPIDGEIVLRLPENPSTGYRWAVEAVDAKLVDVQENEYVPLSDTVGSGGVAQWIIRAKATGTTQIRLKRWRHWEGERSVLERFEFTLRIVR